ncbi:disease resistance protein Pik-2-like [Phragmites australis]|uniref:disease resistance protein Pik-2-like n=1 Tax=Phragmites australis TaxID=29695 RepID=UPI002D79ED7A|nr:disease resistance protein Pik-2-like [Phragmites australis]
MDLVVGASESTVKSLLGKLGSLLAQEYTLIRGVAGDLQYINDELTSMQSFLRDLGAAGDGRGHGHDHRMKDWMKQIRDLTYDIEDCVDDSGHRIRGLPSDMCCYFLVNSVYEVLTWWPRRDIATKISNLKMRAQQIGERRHRYGVDNPKSGDSSISGVAADGATGFNAAENQDSSLELVTMKTPVGVDKDMEELEKWVTGEATTGVLSIVGFGGVGKTTIATALHDKFRDQFDHRAVVTVSQSSDIEAILSSILSQVKPQSNDQEQRGSSPKKSLAAAMRGALDHVTRTSNETKDNTKLDQLKEDLQSHLKKHSYLVLIDDVWSTTTWGKIRNLFPQSAQDMKKGRIIVTTRFPAVATACQRESGDLSHKVRALTGDKPKELFKQAFTESKGSEDVKILFEVEELQRNSKEISEGAVQSPQGSSTSQTVQLPQELLNMCGGLPLVLVTMAGHVACSTNKSFKEWIDLCKTLLPDSNKDRGEDLTQEEAGRIISHCFNDMPPEIKTCSLYLSIFPKGHQISRKRLTRRWIAEGFVSEKQGLSVEDVAETYFNHLIRRKIIRPVQHSSNGKVKTCVVHDMILEHIVTKANEENFISVVGGHWLMHQPSSKVRRLSLQVSDSKRAKDTEGMNLSHVRSLTVFENLNQLQSGLFKFGIVQVLDLEGCKGFKQQHIKEICGMVLLKYLSLRGTDTKLLPKKIGKLDKLETLDVRETDIVELPTTVCDLERLVNILGGHKKTHKALKLPEELVKKKKMTALRILSGIEIVAGSVDLHHLIELRKLAIYKVSLTEDEDLKELSSSIEYLSGYSLHTLVIDDESSRFLKLLREMSSPPKFLVALELSGKIVKLPDWIAQLDALNKLTLSVTALRTDNLRLLSNLRALFSLTFTLAAGKQGPETLAILAQNKLCSDGEIIVPAGGFESLKLLRFSAPLLPLLSFSENAMPKLESIELRFNMLEGIFGTENIAELKEVCLRLNDEDGEVMAKKIVDEMKSAAKRIGTKRPRITLDH